MTEIILAGSEKIYQEHIRTYQDDKFARYILDINSLRGLREITRVIYAFGWQGKPEYDGRFFDYLNLKLRRGIDL